MDTQKEADKSETPRAASAEAPGATPHEPPKPAAAKRGAGRGVALALVASLLAAGLALLSWYEGRTRVGAEQETVARRMRDIESEASDARSYARQARDALKDVQTQVGRLDTRLNQTQAEQAELDSRYQALARNRDDWQLAEIEQLLAIASQQLQLSGNVHAALLALRLAENRLARAERPQFLPIQHALARDIERLKALPPLDLAGMSYRLDRLALGVDSLPLASGRASEGPAQVGTEAAAPAGANQGVWSRLGGEIWGELKQLVIVRRTDANAPALLTPSESYFLRENLRLRLLNARLSLLMRDEAGYQGQLHAAQAWIERYFDTSAKPTADALTQLRALAAASISLEMPTIADSLDAVRNYKARHEKSGS